MPHIPKVHPTHQVMSSRPFKLVTPCVTLAYAQRMDQIANILKFWAENENTWITSVTKDSTRKVTN